jgi:copper chaperone CopZ
MAFLRNKVQRASKYDQLNISDDVRNRSPLATKMYAKSLQNYEDIIRTEEQPWSETDINLKASLQIEDLIFTAVANGPDGNLITIRIADSVATVPAEAASFSGQVAGMTTNVVITADNDGEDGNSIELIFDGLDDIDTALSDWNLANPANTASLTSGDGSQVPDNGESIQLSGGSEEVPSEVSVTVRNKSITINIEEGVTSNQDVIDAVEASTRASALVSVELDGTDSDPASASDIQSLKNGK